MGEAGSFSVMDLSTLDSPGNLCPRKYNKICRIQQTMREKPKSFETGIFSQIHKIPTVKVIFHNHLGLLGLKCAFSISWEMGQI